MGLLPCRSLAADCPIPNVITVPQFVSKNELVVWALRSFPQFEGVATYAFLDEYETSRGKIHD